MKRYWDRLQRSRVWRSVFRTRLPIKSGLDRSLVIFNSLTLHIHPVKVRERAIRFSYTFYLGFISFFLFVILLVTGVLLMFYYQPDIPNAYENMKDLDYVISYGMFLRNMHRWAGHLMVIVVFLHMLRVFYDGAYKPPREFNWVVGVVLLILTLLEGYTGYLLPYDQLAYWAVTVGANIVDYAPLIGKNLRFLFLGGNEIGEVTLVRFYVLHCIVLPILMIGLIAFHFWRIRKDGGLHYKPEKRSRQADDALSPVQEPSTEIVEDASGPIQVGKRIAVFPQRVPTRFQTQTPPEKLVTTFPHLIIREIICFQILMIGLTVVSLFFDAPLEGLANPYNTPNPSKAPWYFLGIQEMLHNFPPLVSGILLPGMAIIGLLVVPYVSINIRREPLWAHRRQKTLLILSVATLLVAGLSSLFHAFSIAIPTLLLYGLAVIPYSIRIDKGWSGWLSRRSLADWIMTWFVVVVTVLTLIGTHFRGPEWRWVWPWM